MEGNMAALSYTVCLLNNLGMYLPAYVGFHFTSSLLVESVWVSCVWSHPSHSQQWWWGVKWRRVCVCVCICIRRGGWWGGCNMWGFLILLCFLYSCFMSVLFSAFALVFYFHHFIFVQTCFWEICKAYCHYWHTLYTLILTLQPWNKSSD